MEKKLKDIKNEYEHLIPTSFTIDDKQAILEKIREHKVEERRTSFFPKLMTTIVCAAAFLFALYYFTNLPGNESTLDNGSPTIDTKVPKEDEQYFFEIKEENQEQYFTFDPKQVEVGDSFGSLRVDNVERDKEKGTISVFFSGKAIVTGQLYNGDRLLFVPNENTANQIPYAEQDIGTKIQIHFNDDDIIRKIFGINENAENPILLENINFEQIVYLYSVNGSGLHVSVGGFSDEDSWEDKDSKTYTTNIELSKELLTVYDNYAATYDDNLLKNLKPIDIFKLFYHATSLGDVETEYALFIKGENFGTPDKETYMSDPEFWGHDEFQIEFGKEFYEALKEVQSYQEIYLSGEETLVSFSLPRETVSDREFLLLRDPKTGIWKVPMMPYQ